MDLAVIVTVVVVALVFDYTNGFHDAGNAIATSVATRALTPRVALGMAAVLNFVGALLGQRVADTVGSVIRPASEGSSGLVVVLAGLLGAIVWNLLTWWRGLPSSSSHALIGGLVGAALASGSTVRWDVVVSKVIIPMIASPLIGFGLAFAVMLAVLWVLRRRHAHRIQRGFRVAQTVSAAAMALGHGLQDGQKTMGVIFLALLTGGYVGADDPLPLWVILAAATALALGTAAGGWRLMRTLGRRLVGLDPARGFVAESVAAGILYTSAYVFAAPVSTTHTITSAIMGAGATRRLSAIRWNVARAVLVAWVLTVPAAGLVAAGCYGVLRLVLRLP